MKVPLANQCPGVLAALIVMAVSSHSSAAPVGYGVIAPHRAAYQLKLGQASERSGIKAMNGVMVFEVRGSGCEGLIVNYRMRIDIRTEGEPVMAEERASTYEAPDGAQFQFLTQSFVNGKTEKTIKGSAARGDGGLIINHRRPQERRIELEDAMFLGEHTVRVIEAGRMGKKILRADLFDAGDQADAVLATTTFIGARREVSVALNGETAKALHSLAGIGHLPVSTSYFPKLPTKDTSTALPVFETSFLLYENGVSRDLKLRYIDYMLTGDLVRLEMLDPTACETEDSD